MGHDLIALRLKISFSVGSLRGGGDGKREGQC